MEKLNLSHPVMPLRHPAHLFYICAIYLTYGLFGLFFWALLRSGELSWYVFISWRIFFCQSGLFSAFCHQSFRRTKAFPWHHDLFEDSIRAAGITGIEIGTKLYVSNLDYGVTNEDIRVQFEPHIFVLALSIPNFL